jgi:hypothetical protein
MRQHFSLSWRLVRGCLALLAGHPDLLIFPIVSLVATTLVMASIYGASFAWVGFDLQAYSALSFSAKTVIAFAFYLVAYFIAFSANTALVACVLIILDGGEPSLRDGWRVARQHAVWILGYATLMATVGMLFRLIFRRTGWLGSLLSSSLQRSLIFTVVGLGWHLLVYFMAPILVAEKLGPLQAAKRSSELVRTTWGQDVVMNVNVWLIFAIPLFLVVIMGGPMVWWLLGAFDERQITITLWLYIMAFLLALLLKMALDGVFAAVVYRYAAQHDLSRFFTEDLLRHAFHSRPSWAVRMVRRLLGKKAPAPASP